MQIVSKVAAALRSVSVTDAEVKAAKKALTLELTEKLLNSGERAELLAQCALYGYEDFMSEKVMHDAVAQATVADVQVWYNFKLCANICTKNCWSPIYCNSAENIEEPQSQEAPNNYDIHFF